MAGYAAFGLTELARVFPGRAEAWLQRLAAQPAESVGAGQVVE
jgi:hypothetical protein